MAETLIVTILAGKGLEPSAGKSTADPFVIIYSGKKKQRTRIDHKTQTPSWNESFTIQLQRYEALYVECWDSKGKLATAMFEGCFSVNWWSIPELDRVGLTKQWFKLRPGQGKKRATSAANGELFVELRLPHFAQRAQQQGSIRTLFPEIAEDDEEVLVVQKCQVSTILSTEPAPGSVFLLRKHLCFAATAKDHTVKVCSPYEQIATVTKIKRPGRGVGITLASGDEYNIVLEKSAAFHTNLLEAMAFVMNKFQPSAPGPVPKEVAEAPSASAGSAVTAAASASSVSPTSGKKESRGSRSSADLEPIVVKSQTFKVFVRDWRGVGCNPFYFVTVSSTNTFKEVVEHVFKLGNVTAVDAKDFRCFVAPPGVRTQDYEEVKLKAIRTVGHYIKTRKISYGCALQLKRYEKGASTNDLRVSLVAVTGTAEPLSKDVIVPRQGSLKPAVVQFCEANGVILENSTVSLLGFDTEPTEAQLLTRIDPFLTAHQLGLSDGDTIIIRTKPPFKALSEKFGTREDNHLAFFLACLCEVEPIQPKPDGVDILVPLRQALMIEEDDAAKILESAKQCAAFGNESMLVELEDRLRLSKSLRWYNESAFETPAIYEQWLDDRRKDIIRIMRLFLFEARPFVGLLQLTISKIEGLPPAALSGGPEMFCEVGYTGQRAHTKTTKKSQIPQTWNETLNFYVSSLNSLVNISILDWARFMKNETIGTASINLREILDSLDGDAHDLQLPISTPPGGILHVRVQLHFEFSEYLRRAATMPLEVVEVDNAPNFSTLFNLVFGAAGVAFPPADPGQAWLLDEFGTRFGVTPSYVAILRLQNVLYEPLSPAVSREIWAGIRAVLRPTVVQSKLEEANSAKLVEAFVGLMQREMIPLCFSRLATDAETVVPLLRALKEALDVMPDLSEGRPIEAILEEGVRSGISGQVGALFMAVPWETDRASAVCTESLRKVPGAIRNTAYLLRQCLSESALAKLWDILMEQWIASVEKHMGFLCGSMAKFQQPDEPTFELLSVLAEVEDVLTNEARRDVRLKTYSALSMQWLKRSKDVLFDAVEKAVADDRREVVAPGESHSTAVLQVFASVSQIVSRVGMLRVRDPFVWATASELATNAVKSYITSESELAEEVVQDHEDDFSEDEVAVQDFCVAIGNITHAQRLLGPFGDIFVQGLERYQALYGESDRLAVSRDTVQGCLASANAVIKEGIENAAMALSCLHINPRIEPIFEEAASFGRLDFAAEVTQVIDDVLLKLRDHISNQAYKSFLGKSWSVVCECMWAAVQPRKSREKGDAGLNDAERRTAFEACVSSLLSYFSVEGEGFAVAQLEANLAYVNSRRLLALYRMRTGDLIALAKSLNSDGPPSADPPLDNPALAGITPDDPAMIIEERKRLGDAWAAAFDQEESGSEQSAKVRQYFALPPDELLINKFMCFYQDRKMPGMLYLTSRHICYDLLTGKVITEPLRVVLMLKEILFIERVDWKLYKGVKIKMPGNPPEEHVFTVPNRLIMTSSLFNAILDQAVDAENVPLRGIQARERSAAAAPAATSSSSSLSQTM